MLYTNLRFSPSNMHIATFEFHCWNLNVQRFFSCIRKYTFVFIVCTGIYAYIHSIKLCTRVPMHVDTSLVHTDFSELNEISSVMQKQSSKAVIVNWIWSPTDRPSCAMNSLMNFLFYFSIFSSRHHIFQRNHQLSENIQRNRGELSGGLGIRMSTSIAPKLVYFSSVRYNLSTTLPTRTIFVNTEIMFDINVRIHRVQNPLLPRNICSRIFIFIVIFIINCKLFSNRNF